MPAKKNTDELFDCSAIWEIVEIIARQTAAEELYGVPANDNEAPDATAEGSK